MKLFLIRHGESENNFNRRYSGQCNPKLTDLGRKQAENIRPLLEKINFDAVYSSDLSRAKETCSIAIPNSKPILTEKIREIAIGDWENKPYYLPKSSDDEIAIALDKNRRDFNYSPYGGENAEDVKKRIADFLKELEGKPYKNVAAFCHAGLMTIMLSYVLSANIDRYAIMCPNCAISIFEFDGKNWKLSVWNYGAKTGEASE